MSPDADPENPKEVIEAWNPLLENKKEDFGGIVEGWAPLQRFEAWKMVHEFYRETSRTRSRIMVIVVGGVILTFVAWAAAALVYLTFFNGDVKSLLAIGSFVSTPLGLIIGYYFGTREETNKPDRPHK